MNSAEPEWTPQGACAICSERIESSGRRYRHAHADKDTHCGTGDGSVAQPALPTRAGCQCVGGPHGGHTCDRCRTTR